MAVPLHKKFAYRDIVDMLPLPWENTDIVFEHDGHAVTQIDNLHDAGLEGFMLAHCLGTKDRDFFDNHLVFSIRDARMVPHATILYAKNRVSSPYGVCNDLLRSGMAMRQGTGLHLLQIRGRHDAVAHIVYHRVARAFHQSMAGTIQVEDGLLDYLCMAYGDNDLTYHRSLWLHRRNDFNPEWWKENARK